MRAGGLLWAAIEKELFAIFHAANLIIIL